LNAQESDERENLHQEKKGVDPRLDDLQEDLREIGIEGWRRKLRRDQWRRIAQEAKAHVGL
jgi:hypothetical protein